MTNTNPWLVGPDHAPAPETPVLLQPQRTAHFGATAPQRGVPVPDTADRLPRRNVTGQATVWWLGVHGGAGETTLSALAGGSRPADHAWPVPAVRGTSARVVLVARSNYTGLMAAQKAAIEWASNSVDDSIILAGLVLIADAPGRQPKPLRELEQIIAGGVPQVWHLPWVESWRFGPALPDETLPKPFRTLLSDLSLTLSSTSAQNRKD